MRTIPILAVTALSFAVTGCASLTGFTQQAVEIQAAATPVDITPIQIGQKLGVFGFCRDCPPPTEKQIYPAIDANSPDAATRALARLRAQLASDGPKTGRQGDLLFRQIPPISNGGRITDNGLQNGADVEPRWVIFALMGAPDDPTMQAEFTRVVRRFPGSSFHFFADASSLSQMDAFESLLHTVGDPKALTTTSLLQTNHRSDERLRGTLERTPSPSSVQLLIIRK
jgi:hypothetical protein